MKQKESSHILYHPVHPEDTTGNTRYNSVTGMYFSHSENLWYHISTGQITPDIPETEAHSTFFDHGLMDAETGKYKSEEAVEAHYILCTVAKTVCEFISHCTLTIYRTFIAVL